MAKTGDEAGSTSQEPNAKPSSQSSTAPPPPPATALLTSGNTGSSSTSRSGSRGPIGPKPGVFRPCARCRQKKTKCDRLKPTCSNCKKGGADVLCVYDNDEPTEGVLTSLPPEYAQTEPYGTSATPSTGSTPKGSRRLSTARSPTPSSMRSHGTSSSPMVPSLVATQLPTAADTTTRQSEILTGTEMRLLVQKPSPATEPSTPAGRGRRGKALMAASTAIQPSPLRTSSLAADTARSPSPTSISGATSAEKHQSSILTTDALNATHKPSRGSSKKVNEEIVSGLSIKEQEGDDAMLKKDDDAASDAATPTPTAPPTPSKPRTLTPSAGVVNGSNPPSRTAGGGGTGSGNSRILADLAAAAARAPPPAPPLVIDANQRARKWGRPSVIFRTLGGEVGLPLWISDQDMLLNDPKQIIYIDHEQLIQQHQKERMMSVTASVSGGNSGSGSSGRGGAPLSRLAVLKQLDHHHTRQRTTTPDRGNTPESNESTPAPTPGPKKRRGRRQHHGSVDSNARSMIDSDIEIYGGADDGDEGEGTGDEVSMVSSQHQHHRRLKKRRILNEGDGSEALGGRGGGRSSGSGSTKEKGIRAPRTSQQGPSPRPRTFKCSYPDCPKSFMDQVQLDRHERRHGTDDFECGIDGCTKMYSSISTMRRHQSMVHKRRQQPIVRAREGAIPFTASAVLRKRAQSAASGVAMEGALGSPAANIEDEDDEEDDEDDDDDDDDDEVDEDLEEDDEVEEEESEAAVEDNSQELEEGEGDGGTIAESPSLRPSPYTAGSTTPSSPLHKRMDVERGAASSKVADLMNAPEPISSSSHRLNASSEFGADDTVGVDPINLPSRISTSEHYLSESSMNIDRD
ncbi:hypothetical protein BGW42_004943 [Actinomortierella wolfii]|nr:hypothetical protein BGW42_004943 [Actinomortierella wolfii]